MYQSVVDGSCPNILLTGTTIVSPVPEGMCFMLKNMC